MKRGLILLMFIAIPCWSQTTTTGNAETKGPCSPAVTGSGNTISIKTCGMTDKQIHEFSDLLRQILASQINSKDLIPVLRELESGQIRIENGVVQIEGAVTDLQKQEAPRTISDSAAQRLIVQLSKFKNQKIQLTFTAVDNETARLAQRLQAIFRMAGWNVPDGLESGAFFFTGGPLIGIQVQAKENTPAAISVLNALRSVLPDVNATLSNLPDDTVSITIYPKR